MLGVLSGAGAASAAPGDLDLSFDGDGKKTIVDADVDVRGEAVAFRPSTGSIVLAGSTDPHVAGQSEDFAFAEVNSTGGTVITRAYNFEGTSDEQAFGLAVHPNNLIVMAGVTDPPGQPPTNDFGLARINTSDYTLDMGFSADGTLAFDFAPFGSTDVARDVAFDADLRMVAVGSTRAGSGNDDFAIARFLPADGFFDGSFSGDGQQVTDFGGIEQAQAVAIQPNDHKIVVAGFVGSAGNFDFALARYRPIDGSLDPAFAVPDGRLTTDFGSVTDEAHAVALQPDGKILVAGQSGPNFALARYNENGTLDSGFSAPDGKLTTDFAGSTDNATGVAVQPNGKIVVGGYAFVQAEGNHNFAVARYNTDGSLDTGFSEDGKQTAAFGANDIATGLVIQPDGKIVLGGFTEVVDGDFAVARFEGDGPGGPPGDSDPPGATLAGSKKQKLGKFIVVTVTSDEAGTATASGSLSVPKAAKAFRLGKATKKVAAGAKVKLKLKVSKKARKAARKALKRRKKVKAKVTVAVTDASGNSSPKKKRTVKLKR